MTASRSGHGLDDDRKHRDRHRLRIPQLHKAPLRLQPVRRTEHDHRPRVLQALIDLAFPRCPRFDPGTGIAVEKDLFVDVAMLESAPQHLVRDGFVFGLVADEEHEKGLSIPMSATTTQTLSRPFDENGAWKVMRPCSQLYTTNSAPIFPARPAAMMQLVDVTTIRSN